MKNLDFYICLNVLNIALSIITVIMLIAFWNTEETNPFCLFILLIIIKLLLLPILFNFTKKFFKNSLLNKVEEKLKVETKNKKLTLLLALGYDIISILFLSLPLFKETDLITVLYFPIFWGIFTFGGICMFYIGLFLYWKIRNKERFF